MKIGIDCLFIRPGKNGGTESYLRNLLKGLHEIDDENEYYLFTTFANNDSFKFVKNNFHTILCNVDGQNKIKRVLFSVSKLPSIVEDLKLDLMFFPSYIRTPKKIKNTITVSNVHDIQYKHFPHYFTLTQKLIFKFFYPVSFKKSDKIVCISDFAKEDIMSRFPNVNKDKFTKIYNPIDFEKIDNPDAAEATQGGRGIDYDKNKYIISIASLLPHKNIDTLVKAFAEFKRTDTFDIKLILVGIKGKATETILNKVKELRIEDSVIIPGYVNDQQLSMLYKNAAVFVSTSLFEGFGMPPVEAMYMRLPTITTRCTSLPEVTLNNALYYNDPYNYVELANLLKRVIDNPPESENLLKISNEIKKAYNLEKIAREYKTLFESLKISITS